MSVHPVETVGRLASRSRQPLVCSRHTNISLEGVRMSPPWPFGCKIKNLWIIGGGAELFESYLSDKSQQVTLSPVSGRNYSKEYPRDPL